LFAPGAAVQLGNDQRWESPALRAPRVALRLRSAQNDNAIYEMTWLLECSFAFPRRRGEHQLQVNDIESASELASDFPHPAGFHEA
jgi:hypothetical protein